jgi:hypothetical protein
LLSPNHIRKSDEIKAYVQLAMSTVIALFHLSVYMLIMVRI